MIDLEERGLRPDAAEILAKEMQMIVAADRWKGRRLDATPPEKWHRLRPETQQFWIDEATRIITSLEAVQQPEVAKLIADKVNPLIKLLERAYDALGDDLSPSKFNKLMADIERVTIRAEAAAIRRAAEEAGA